jgi:hypothetical protein
VATPDSRGGRSPGFEGIVGAGVVACQVAEDAVHDLRVGDDGDDFIWVWHSGQRRGSISRTFSRRRAQEALRALSLGDSVGDEGGAWAGLGVASREERTRLV